MSGANLRKLQLIDENQNDISTDDSTRSLISIDYAHHEIHGGSYYGVALKDLTFQKNGEMGIIFTTPDTTKWFHILYFAKADTKSSFDVLEGPTVDVANYPTTFYTPRNKNRNSSNVSTAISVRAVPAVNEVSLVLDGDTTPVSADGTVYDTEVLGASKNQSPSAAVRGVSEMIAEANTVYYFRLLGDNTGTDNLGASMKLGWYEHTNKSV